MTQYIDKSAVVAEIENKIEKYTKRGEESDAKRDGYGMYWGGVISCLNEVRSFLDTLEVKEIDLAKEVDLLIKSSTWAMANREDFLRVAKHFYELGIKSKGE